MRLRLTTSRIRSLRPTDAGELLVWDSGLPGFGIRIGQKRRSFICQYRTRGKTRRMRIGTWPRTSLVEARRKAAEVFSAVEQGLDPAQERYEKSEIPSLEEFAARYLEEHARPKKRPRSVHTDECHLRRHILPALGRYQLNAISHREVVRLHASMKSTPYSANRVIALLRHMYRLAEKWGEVPPGTNPAVGVQMYPETPRERYLRPSESARLGCELEKAEEAGTNPLAIAALRLIILTGARMSEITHLRWSEVDREAACLRLPATRTKEKRAKSICLAAAALQVLANLPRLDDELVFPNSRGTGPIRVVGTWHRIRKSAELEGFRLHDLRHSFASTAASGGTSLLMIGKLLGHRRPATTARYAHISDDPLRRANEAIGARIAASLEQRDPAQVLPIRGRSA